MLFRSSTTAEVGPFAVRTETSRTNEIGYGINGASAATGGGFQVGIHNPNNNDSFYAGCDGTAGTKGNNEVGCRIGVTAGRDDGHTFGGSLGVGTSSSLGLSRECTYPQNGPPQVETTLKVPIRIPLVPVAPATLQVSERHPAREGECPGAERPSQGPVLIRRTD